MKIDQNTIGFNIDEVVKACMEKINNIKLSHLNIIVTGKSGSGKSTLINNVFKDKLAETGVGRPVTTEIQKITRKGYPLTIYDTPGFEMSDSQQDNVKSGILHLIDEGIESGDPEKAIHCIWYCINVGTNRIDPKEVGFIRSISEASTDTHIPVIVIFTQASNKTKAAELRSALVDEHLQITEMVTLLAERETDGDRVIQESYGLDELVDIMVECLPDELVDTFHHMQVANLEAKAKYSRQAIATAVAAAFTACFVPASGADAALLIPIQLGMLAKITSNYGIDIERDMLKCFISYTIGVTGATLLGRTAAGEIVKMIPVLGTMAGGIINAGTASVITTALGEAYIKIMEMFAVGDISKDELMSDRGKELITGIFNAELQAEKDD